MRACERFYAFTTLFTRQGLFHPGGQVLGRGKMQPNAVLATAADPWARYSSELCSFPATFAHELVWVVGIIVLCCARPPA